MSGVSRVWIVRPVARVLVGSALAALLDTIDGWASRPIRWSRWKGTNSSSLDNDKRPQETTLSRVGERRRR
jgi:hypothetical protein